MLYLYANKRFLNPCYNRKITLGSINTKHFYFKLIVCIISNSFNYKLLANLSLFLNSIKYQRQNLILPKQLEVVTQSQFQLAKEIVIKKENFTNEI